MTKLIYDFHAKLRSAFQWAEDMRTIAEMDEDTKKTVVRAIKFATTLKGPEIKQFLSDLTTAANPYERINSDFTVESEAAMLTDELGRCETRFKQLSLFSKEYMDELKERTQQAQIRADQVRSERERRAEEQRKAGLLPFPSQDTETYFELDGDEPEPDAADAPPENPVPESGSEAESKAEGEAQESSELVQFEGAKPKSSQKRRANG